MPVQALTFEAADGVRLYGAVFGTGARGAVLANDVPHPLCEEIPPATFLARRGFRVLIFDYRGHGESPSTGAPGRLDRDVAGAVTELQALGPSHAVVLGSYAGVAATVVAATQIHPPIDAIVGFSPAAYRGQYVGGPLDPQGALQAAPSLRVPTLYVTVRNDPFVSVREVNRLYSATGSRVKQLVVIPYGSASWDLLTFSQFQTRVDKAVLGFIQLHA